MKIFAVVRIISLDQFLSLCSEFRQTTQYVLYFTFSIYYDACNTLKPSYKNSDFEYKKTTA